MNKIFIGLCLFVVAAFAAQSSGGGTLAEKPGKDPSKCSAGLGAGHSGGSAAPLSGSQEPPGGAARAGSPSKPLADGAKHAAPGPKQIPPGAAADSSRPKTCFCGRSAGSPEDIEDSDFSDELMSSDDESFTDKRP